MSTRANIIIEDSDSKLYFYRHSDGYPEGVKESLDKFVKYLRDGKIRNNVSQSSGWLIIIGAEEYKASQIKRESYLGLNEEEEKEFNGKISINPFNWKVGAYEPTTGLHGDIDHLYVIDLEKKEWKEESNWEKYE